MIFNNGAQFRENRIRHGISQTDAAAMLGIHKYTLCRWELGQTNSHRLRYEGALLIESIERGRMAPATVKQPSRGLTDC